jgi:hypothetical protein
VRVRERGLEGGELKGAEMRAFRLEMGSSAACEGRKGEERAEVKGLMESWERAIKAFRLFSAIASPRHTRSTHPHRPKLT